MMMFTFISTVASILPLRPYLERIKEHSINKNNNIMYLHGVMF